MRKLTDGRGADAIFDGVGRDSFAQSRAALAPGGHLISFGQASGPIEAKDLESLAATSARLSCPNFADYTDTPEKVAAITKRLFEAIEQRILSIEVGRRYPLTEAAKAQRALEARETTGSTVLIPDGTHDRSP